MKSYMPETSLRGWSLLEVKIKVTLTCSFSCKASTLLRKPCWHERRFRICSFKQILMVTYFSKLHQIIEQPCVVRFSWCTPPLGIFLQDLGIPLLLHVGKAGETLVSFLGGRSWVILFSTWRSISARKRREVELCVLLSITLSCLSVFVRLEVKGLVEPKVRKDHFVKVF